MRFDDFAQSWNSDPEIPDDELYKYLELVRPALLEIYNSNPDEIPSTRLGVEVRRRCQRDLFWMARFFTWGTSPEGVDSPIEENDFTEDPYGFICDEFFVQKDPSKKIRDQDTSIKVRQWLWPRGAL